MDSTVQQSEIAAYLSQTDDSVRTIPRPYDARLMRCYPISSRINQVANDDEACAVPVEIAEVQSGLF